MQIAPSVSQRGEGNGEAGNVQENYSCAANLPSKRLMLATCSMKGNISQQELGGMVGFFNSFSPMYRKTIDAY